MTCGQPATTNKSSYLRIAATVPRQDVPEFQVFDAAERKLIAMKVRL